MAFWIVDTSRAKINQNDGIEDKGKYSSVKLSSSEKKQDSKEYEYSDWFARFVGKAHTKLQEGVVTNGAVIVLTKAKMTRVPYLKDEKKTWGAGQLVVFDFEVYSEGSKPKKSSKKSFAPAEEEDDSDSIPF